MAGQQRPLELKVISFNIWGLHLLDSTHIRERLVHIAPELKSYDIVGLQEVWKRDDFNFLVKELDPILPYHHYFHSGAIGSGLCVFSRHPIMCSHSHPFTVSGSVRFFLDGELFAGKGVMMCRILTPAGPIAFYNTHLDPRQRESQIFEVYKFVDHSRGQDPVIVTGDFNTKPSHASYEFLVSSLDVEDAFQDDPTDTCDLRTNLFTKKHMSPKRIDYVFHSDKMASLTSLSLKERRLAITGPIPGKKIHYSDHEGVEATFTLQPRAEEMSVVPNYSLNDSKVHIFLKMAESIRVKQARVKTNVHRIVMQWITLGTIITFLVLLSHFYVHPLLASYGLGLLVVGGVALMGGGGVFLVVLSIANAKTYLGLEANLAEIRTLLTFNTVVKAMTGYVDLDASFEAKKLN